MTKQTKQTKQGAGEREKNKLRLMERRMKVFNIFNQQ